MNIDQGGASNYGYGSNRNASVASKGHVFVRKG